MYGRFPGASSAEKDLDEGMNSRILEEIRDTITGKTCVRIRCTRSANSVSCTGVAACVLYYIPYYDERGVQCLTVHTAPAAAVRLSGGRIYSRVRAILEKLIPTGRGRGSVEVPKRFCMLKPSWRSRRIRAKQRTV